MDVHLHGACMGKLVGPAGAGGSGGAGGGISTQFRILPNAMPSEAYPVDSERVPVHSQRPALHLRLSSTTPHRHHNPEPLKIGDEHHSSGSNSPLAEPTSGFLLLHDVPAGPRTPSLTHPSVTTSPSKALKRVTNEAEELAVQDENLIAID